MGLPPFALQPSAERIEAGRLAGTVETFRGDQ
jgi:hypothetical protein